MTTMDDHDWKRGEMVGWPEAGPFKDIFVWRCRRCKSVIRAMDSAGRPGTAYSILGKPSLRGRYMTCEEAIVEEIHRS